MKTFLKKQNVESKIKKNANIRKLQKDEMKNTFNIF